MIQGALLVLLLLAALPAAGESAAYRRSPTGELLPDKDITPGVVALHDAKHVCGVAWGKDARHVTETMKATAYHDYGATKKATVCCEVDHLISRELGGADEPKNLWPQPWHEARMKDRVENALHKDVCAGVMTLSDAQDRIRSDWSKEYHRRYDE